jgi:hypothetical protein
MHHPGDIQDGADRVLRSIGKDEFAIVFQRWCDGARCRRWGFNSRSSYYQEKVINSIRPLGTTNSLIIWVKSWRCIRPILPPYREKGQQPGKEGQERRPRWERRVGCVDRREGGRKLEVEDVASGTEEAKAA